MAYKLTEEMIYKLEHKVLCDCCSVFECDSDEERARYAVWSEGVRDMGNTVVLAIKELNNK